MSSSPRAIARTTAVFFPITIVLGVVAAGYISGKLVVLRGVDEPRWLEQARASATSEWR